MSNPPKTLTRWWDLPATLLLLAALLTAVTRLVATKWTKDLSIVQTLCFLGLIAGLALGKSRFAPRLAFVFGAAYGLFAVPWQLGLTVKDTVLWSDRLAALRTRLSLIIEQIQNKETVNDSLLFLVLMCFLFWAIATHAGYTLVRYGNAWRAILPAGLTMFVIHAFDPLVTRRAWYLATYLFFALILIARMVFLQRQKSWQNSRTALPPHLGLDFIRVAIIASAVIILLSWSIPVLANAWPTAQKAWRPIKTAWTGLREDFKNAFASLNPAVDAVSEYYGTSAVLGRGNALKDTVVFTVIPPKNMPSNLRLYWRARTYETYDDGQWFSAITKMYEFDPKTTDLSFPQTYDRWLGTFSFIGATHLATLYVPSQPLWVNRPALVEFLQNPDTTVDLSSFHANPSLDPGDMYQAQASVSNASIVDLKATTTEYPVWVTERYLQLPNSITPRTRQLAQDITKDLETPYEKVNAITEYLRQNITYVAIIQDELPRNQEPIDWFLFDERKGFCNYYSTAEVILLRSIGIPARWAVGYAQGVLNPDGNYMVRQTEAHAWPEIYFTGVGWVEFEPTASQPEIVRRSGVGVASSETSGPNPDDLANRYREMEDELALLREQRERLAPITAQKKPVNVVYWLIPLVLGSGLIYLGRRYLPRINWQITPVLLEKVMTRAGLRPPKALQLWARRAELNPLARAYLEINHALTRLGKKPAPNDTPNERAINLSQEIPPALEPAQQLVFEYQIETFGEQPANIVVAMTSAAKIRKLSFRAVLERLLARLQRPLRKTRQNW